MAEVSLTTGARIQVNNIFCIGRNYLAHINELNNEQPVEPVVFTKPTSALSVASDIYLPNISQDVHYETEIVVLIGKGGKDITREDAHSHVLAYGVGLDLTARDLQATAKQSGLPWALAKGFDGAACVSTFLPAQQLDAEQALTFSMQLNGDTRQQGDSRLMIFPIAEQIAYLSRFFTLSPGDLLFTGTPEGVGPLNPGDAITLNFMDKVHASFQVHEKD